MDALSAMQTFVRVVELGSFTGAADDLGLPKASVSNAVRQLEAGIGTRLLHRTTRRIELTQDGRAYYERCKDLLADVDELQTMFERAPQALRGRLRVDMPAGMARNFVLPNLPAFLARHPQLEIEVSATDRRVDVVREGFDCVLRIGALGDSNLFARRLGSFAVVSCASPAYLERYGTPRTPDDLDGHRLVQYAMPLGAKPELFEYAVGKGTDGRGGYASKPLPGVITVNNADAYNAACLAGLGIAQLPSVGAREAIARGALVEILADYRPEPMPVSLVYANRRHLPRRVQAFMDWLAALLQPHLDEVA